MLKIFLNKRKTAVKPKIHQNSAASEAWENLKISDITIDFEF